MNSFGPDERARIRERKDFTRCRIQYCLTLNIQSLIMFGNPEPIVKKDSNKGPQHWKYNRNLRRIPYGYSGMEIQLLSHNSKNCPIKYQYISGYLEKYCNQLLQIGNQVFLRPIAHQY